MELHSQIREEVRNLLSKNHDVKTDDLDYIGFSDETLTIGKIMIYFNIMDLNHPKYKSTICYMF